MFCCLVSQVVIESSLAAWIKVVSNHLLSLYYTLRGRFLWLGALWVMSSDTFKRELSTLCMFCWVAGPLNTGDRCTQTHVDTQSTHISHSLLLCHPNTAEASFQFVPWKHPYTHTHTYIHRHNWCWLLRGPCWSVCWGAFKRCHLPPSPLPPFSFYLHSDLSSMRLSVVHPAGQKCREEGKKSGKRRSRYQKSPLLHWHLDLHFSFSWVTKYINTRFKLSSLASLSPRTHIQTHTLTHTFMQPFLWLF